MEPFVYVVFLIFRLNIYIEQKALDTIAYLCDGDARTGLNSLQLAVQAQMKSVHSTLLTREGSSQEVVVTEQHIKEGLQRSHILYDKAGKLSTFSSITRAEFLHFCKMLLYAVRWCY